MNTGCPLAQALQRSQAATRREKRRHGAPVKKKMAATARWSRESLIVLTTKLSDVGGPARPHWQPTRLARIRSSDFG
jgi:hypothetical protein